MTNAFPSLNPTFINRNPYPSVKASPGLNIHLSALSSRTCHVNIAALSHLGIFCVAVSCIFRHFLVSVRPSITNSCNLDIAGLSVSSLRSIVPDNSSLCSNINTILIQIPSSTIYLFIFSMVNIRLSPTCRRSACRVVAASIFIIVSSIAVGSVIFAHLHLPFQNVSSIRMFLVKYFKISLSNIFFKYLFKYLFQNAVFYNIFLLFFYQDISLRNLFFIISVLSISILSMIYMRIIGSLRTVMCRTDRHNYADLRKNKND